MTSRTRSATETCRARRVRVGLATGCAIPFAVLLIAAPQATAQTAKAYVATPEVPQPAAAAAEQTTEAGDMMDVADLIRKLRHKDQPPAAETEFDYRKAMRAFAPVIGAKPSSGIIVGVAGNVGFFRGDPSTTRISSSVASVTVTTKKQAGISAHTTMFGRDDRWLLELDHRFQWTSQETFGLGDDHGVIGWRSRSIRFLSTLPIGVPPSSAPSLWRRWPSLRQSRGRPSQRRRRGGMATVSLLPVQRRQPAATRHPDIRRSKRRGHLGQSRQLHQSEPRLARSCQLPRTD
jgi:hypothetical protein